MRWPVVSRATYHAACAAADRLTALLEQEQRLHALTQGVLCELMRGPQTRDLSAVRSAITEADAERADAPSAEPARVLDAVTPDVLAACRQFAYGDRRQESANRAYAYTLARKGADEAQILRALRLGDRAEDVA